MKKILFRGAQIVLNISGWLIIILGAYFIVFYWRLALWISIFADLPFPFVILYILIAFCFGLFVAFRYRRQGRSSFFKLKKLFECWGGAVLLFAAIAYFSLHYSSPPPGCDQEGVHSYVSPARQWIAEIHGEGCGLFGPHEIYLTIRRVEEKEDMSLHARVYNFGDVEGVRLRWIDDKNLEIELPVQGESAGSAGNDLSSKDVIHRGPDYSILLPSQLPTKFRGLRIHYKRFSP